MAADRPDRNRVQPGEALASRLTGREQGLYRRRMPDGGEVFTGPLVDRLMGSFERPVRGFFVNGLICVPSSFDASKPQDVATYVHERIHARNEGRNIQKSEGYQGDHPSEDERIARRSEEMVLHALSLGTSVARAIEEAVMADRNDEDKTPSGTPQSKPSREERLRLTYQRLRDEGLTHNQVVRQLADSVMVALPQIDRDARFRRGDGLEG